MPRHLLSVRQVQSAPAGDHLDGDGLLLRVNAKRASWVLRYTSPNGKRREMGLGSADRSSAEAAGATLKRARKKAQDARDLIDKGTDPIDAKRSQKATERAKAHAEKSAKKSAAATLLRYARAYHEQHVEPVRTDKHGKQWIASIEQHVPASLLATPIDRITAVDLLDQLVPILRKVPETGSRVYPRQSAFGCALAVERKATHAGA
jgi:hypothetical protein